MACWSAENATRAYLNTMKMGKRENEPDMAEFISALAAGNNAQLMVVACAGATISATVALVAAAHQTGGQVICILPSERHLFSSHRILGHVSVHVKFVIGEAQYLLAKNYREADFVMIDCKLEDPEKVYGAIPTRETRKDKVVLGYNVLCKGSWSWGGSETQLLPIGEGLLINRISAKPNITGHNKDSRWIVRVDQCTGEEHVFRVRIPQRKSIVA